MDSLKLLFHLAFSSSAVRCAVIQITGALESMGRLWMGSAVILVTAKRSVVGVDFDPQRRNHTNRPLHLPIVSCGEEVLCR